MSNLKRKKSVKQKEKGPTKRFSYDLMSRKRLGQEIEKFLAHQTSKGFVKQGQKKEADKAIFCSEVERIAVVCV